MIPDVARTQRSDFKSTIDRVGMGDIEVPIAFELPNLGKHHAKAFADAYVSLDDPESKGIHMSRLFLCLQRKLSEQPFSMSLMHDILGDFLVSHSDVSGTASLAIRSEIPARRKALLSDNYGFRYYPITLRGTRQQGCDWSEWEVDLKIVYSSTCPCSAALARQLIQKNFSQQFTEDFVSRAHVAEWLGQESAILATPHGQRSHADVTIKPERGLEVSELLAVIDGIESVLQTPVQAAVKREDEQEFARLNGQNLMFAEDAARKVGQYLETNQLIVDYRVKASHYESLHPHDAVAIITKGKKIAP